MDKVAVQKLLDSVKENHEKLSNCLRHDFKMIDPNSLLSKFKCSTCDGELNHINVIWYEKGLRDALR